MTNKSTKRALLTSVVALILCFTMLLGTTYAWFTDSVTSSGNKIVSGTLDVQLWMYTGTDVQSDGMTAGYADISDSTSPIFGEGSIAQNNNAETLWEPGKTQVAYLAIKNNGNLDLKYTVGLNVQNVSKDLYEVMEYAIVPDAQYNSVTSWTSGNSVVEGTQSVSGDVALKVGETHYFALVIHMDEEAGSEYMGGQVSFDLTVLATQLNSESDAFNSDYDKDAAYSANDETSLALAIQKGGTVVLTDDVTLTTPISIPEGVSVTLDLNGSSVNATSGNAIVNNGVLTITDGTISATSAYAISNNGSLTVDGATVENGVYNSGYMVVNSGKIFTTRGGSSHAVYHAGTMLTVNGGEFSGNGNELIYALNSATVIINDGTFDKVEKASYLVRGLRLKINGGTFYAYDENGANPADHYAYAMSGIAGGTFNYEVNANHLAYGDYAVVDNGDGTWTVTAE